MKELLTQLAEVWGPPGREEAVAAALGSLLAPHLDTLRTDALGNLLGVRLPRGQGTGSRILLLAHMDGPGGIVTGSSDQGFLHFQPVGDLSLVAARGQRVRFRDGRPGVLDGEHVAEPKDVKAANSWVDVGAADRAQAGEWVSPGEFFVVDQPVVPLGERLTGPNLDNRAGCAVLVQTVRELENSPHEVHVAFTVQGQVAPRGAITGTFQVQPDLAVVVDLSPARGAGDTQLQLGGGPGLRLRERGWLLRPEARTALETAAATAGVRVQPEILAGGASEAVGIQAVAAGVPVALLTIPGRYLGTPVEMIDLHDLRGAVDWLLALLRHPLPPM